VFLACFCLLFSLGALNGCSEKPQLKQLPPGSIVLAFGDSVTFGVGSGGTPGYPARLAKATGWQIINGGISGDTALKAKNRLGGLLAKYQPALVIVELGGNDFLRRRTESQVKADLKSIVTESLASGAITVLVAVPRLSLLRATAGALKDASLYEELAEETGAILVPDVFSEILSEDRLKADDIHPNGDGYEVLAQGILFVFQASVAAGVQ